MLREDQIRRYSRHILLPDVGGTGQARLLAASVSLDLTIDRAAATVAAVYLTAAGIGTLALSGADPALVAALAALNPDVTVVTGSGAGQRVPTGSGAGHRFPDIAGSEVADALVSGGLVACGIVHGIVAAG